MVNKKMKSKKAVAILLSAATVMSLAMSGCGGGGGENKGSQPAGTTASTEENKVDDGGKVNGVFYAEGLPIADNDFSFTVFCDDSSKDGNFYMLPILEEQTGVKMIVDYYPNEVAKEKLSLALSSGDYADCIGGWLLADSDILKYGVNQQIFIPLEDYIDQYAPNIKAILDLPGVRAAMTAPDGHIYTIPYVTKAPVVDYNIFVNTRWLKNVGMEMPTTTEEYKAVLKAFKEQDANGNGDPSDEIPLSFDPNNKHIGYTAGWFGMPVDNYGMVMKDGKLTFGANTEEYKQGIKFLAELNAEGLIDSEAFTQDLSQWKAKGGQDRFGSSMMYASSDIIPYNPGVIPDWLALPVLDGGNGQTPLWYADSNGLTVLKTQLALTDKAQNPGAIIRYWDNAFTLENSLQIVNGPIGTCLIDEEKDNEKGYRQYRLIDKSTLSKEDQEKLSWANLFPQSLPHYTPADYKLTEDVPLYQEKDVTDAAYAGSLTEPIPDYWVALEDADKLSEYQTVLKDYIAQKAAEWISGQADIDKEWDSYCKQLETLGLKQYIEIREKALEVSQKASQQN